jgi:hypothetical protein
MVAIVIESFELVRVFERLVTGLRFILIDPFDHTYNSYLHSNYSSSFISTYYSKLVKTHLVNSNFHRPIILHMDLGRLIKSLKSHCS